MKRPLVFAVRNKIALSARPGRRSRPSQFGSRAQRLRFRLRPGFLAKLFGTGAGGNTVDNGEVAGSNISIERNPVPVVPEPSTYALMLGGLAAVAWLARRQRRAA